MRCTNVLRLFELLSADMLKLDKLELALIKRELNQKIKVLKQENDILNGMQERFQNDFTALKTLESKGLPFKGLVPLTNRVMIPGRVEEVELLYHAGEGYFVTKSLPRALKMSEESWRNLQKKSYRNQLVTILIESICSFAKQIIFIRRRMEFDGISNEKKSEVEENLLKMYKETISVFNGDVPEKFFDDM
ncbi:unnamed protein product [Nezara viridula]|uniref:Uncharacterized protein n=1 Tax=Nezara viridula TaxID=85310 RepID=A0A9P0H2S7_NEZVI|nr:unnamed protein product [Nezara viridula]